MTLIVFGDWKTQAQKTDSTASPHRTASPCTNAAGSSSRQECKAGCTAISPSCRRCLPLSSRLEALPSGSVSPRRAGAFFRRVNNGLQGRGGGCHRQCRARDAGHSGRAGFSRRRGGGARLAQEHGPGVLVRRQDAEGEGARPLRFFRRGHLPDVGGRRGVEGGGAEDRGRGYGGGRHI